MLHNTLLLFNIFQFRHLGSQHSHLFVHDFRWFFFRKSNPLDCSKTSPPIHQHRNITFPWKISPTQPNPLLLRGAPSTRATATNRRADRVTALSRINPAMVPDLWPVGESPTVGMSRSYRVLWRWKKGDRKVRNLKKQGLWQLYMQNIYLKMFLVKAIVQKDVNINGISLVNGKRYSPKSSKKPIWHLGCPHQNPLSRHQKLPKTHLP